MIGKYINLDMILYIFYHFIILSFLAKKIKKYQLKPLINYIKSMLNSNKINSNQKDITNKIIKTNLLLDLNFLYENNIKKGKFIIFPLILIILRSKNRILIMKELITLKQPRFYSNSQIPQALIRENVMLEVESLRVDYNKDRNEFEFYCKHKKDFLLKFVFEDNPRHFYAKSNDCQVNDNVDYLNFSLSGLKKSSINKNTVEFIKKSSFYRIKLHILSSSRESNENDCLSVFILLKIRFFSYFFNLNSVILYNSLAKIKEISNVTINDMRIYGYIQEMIGTVKKKESLFKNREETFGYIRSRVKNYFERTGWVKSLFRKMNK